MAVKTMYAYVCVVWMWMCQTCWPT